MKPFSPKVKYREAHKPRYRDIDRTAPTRPISQTKDDSGVINMRKIKEIRDNFNFIMERNMLHDNPFCDLIDRNKKEAKPHIGVEYAFSCPNISFKKTSSAIHGLIFP